MEGKIGTWLVTRLSRISNDNQKEKKTKIPKMPEAVIESIFKLEFKKIVVKMTVESQPE